MKKLLLLFVMGIFMVSCSVEEEELLPAQQEFPTLEAVYDVPPGCPVSNIQNALCAGEINNPTVRGFTNYVRNLIFINTNLRNITGTFEPSMAQLLEQYNANGGLGTFNTTYTATDSECGTFSIDISIEVNNCSVDPEPCLPTVTESLCLSQINNATLSGFRTYFRNLVFVNTDLTSITGTFNPTIAELYDQYSASGPLGTYNTTYHVETAECGPTSMDISVEVRDCTQQEPVCGRTINEELCTSEINNPTLQGFRNYLKNLIFLNSDLTTITGTFNPSVEDLHQEYMNSTGTGTFSTVYTVNMADCGETTFVLNIEVEDCN